MNKDWRTYLKILARPVNPTDEQITKLIDGWEKRFQRLKITDPDEQGRELKKILSIRIRATGNISILAPEDDDIILPELGLDEQ